MEMVRAIKTVFVAFLVFLPALAAASPSDVSFTVPSAQIDRYDFVEITANVQAPDTRNPFVDASLTGVVETLDSAKTWQVEGFCDSTDGSTFRLRFMAPEATTYKYTVTYKQGQFQKASSGTFQCGRCAQARNTPCRPQLSMAFHLGGYRRALLFQRNDRLLAGGLARRPSHSIQCGPPSPLESESPPGDDRGPRSVVLFWRAGDD